MRVILDTNVVISGFLWPGVCTQLFALAVDGQLALFTSQELIDELSGVIGRRKYKEVIARTGFTAAQLIKQYRRLVYSVSTKKFSRQICRDADDDAVLACALAAEANLIVTGDKDLLVLHPFQDIPILTPASAIKILAANAQ